MRDVVVAVSAVVIFIAPLLAVHLVDSSHHRGASRTLLATPMDLCKVMLNGFLTTLSICTLNFLPALVCRVVVLTVIRMGVLTCLCSLLNTVLLNTTLVTVNVFVSSLARDSIISTVLAFIVGVLLVCVSNVNSSVDVA